MLEREKSFREKKGKKKIWKLHRVSNKKKVNIVSILLCPLSGLKENWQNNAACCYLQKILGPSCSKGAIHQINHYTADSIIQPLNNWNLKDNRRNGLHLLQKYAKGHCSEPGGVGGVLPIFRPGLKNPYPFSDLTLNMIKHSICISTEWKSM